MSTWYCLSPSIFPAVWSPYSRQFLRFGSTSPPFFRKIPSYPGSFILCDCFKWREMKLLSLKTALGHIRQQWYLAVAKMDGLNLRRSWWLTFICVLSPSQQVKRSAQLEHLNWHRLPIFEFLTPIGIFLTSITGLSQLAEALGVFCRNKSQIRIDAGQDKGVDVGVYIELSVVK